MKAINFLLLAFLFQLCLSSAEKKYKLEIKNGNGDDSPITLVPGVFTKITLVLSSIGEMDYKDESSYTLKFNDEKLVAVKQEIKLVPKESLVYTNYIGFSCSNSVEDNYPLNVVIEAGDKTDDGSLEFSPVSLKVSKVETEIKLDLLLKSFVKNTKNFFKLEEELYNVDQIKISLDNATALAGIELKEGIVIDSFKTREDEPISKDSAANHGILFQYPLLSKGESNDSKLKLKLAFDSATTGACFKLAKTDFDFELKTEGLVNLDAKVKTAIVYNTEDGSPEFDVTNKIQINTLIPVAPVILDCEFSLNSTISNDKGALKSSIEEGTKFFKTVVTAAGQLSIVVEDLNVTSDYKAKCEISTTDSFDEAIKKIEVTIGNYLNADVIKQLVPSKDPNATPQCAKFTFDSALPATAFKAFAPFYCKYFMKKDDALLARALPSIICDPISFSLLPTNEVTLCVAPSPLYNTAKFISKKKETDFNKKFDDFIENLKTLNSGNSTLFPRFSNIEREKDISIDPSSISVSLKEIKTILTVPSEFVFNVYSTHSQNLECFYNSFLIDGNVSFINYLENVFYIAPNEEKTISVLPRIKFVIGDDTFYSLNLRCRNLPGFLFKQESTGNMNKYTYLNPKITINQLVDRISQMEINCNEKKNKLNPRCLKEKIVSVVEQIKTEVPAKIKEIEQIAKQYANTARETKQYILKKLKDEFDALVKKADSKINEIVEKAIEVLKYLSYTDCSIYVSGKASTIEETFKLKIYLECRETKQNIIERIIEVLKEKLQCPALVSLITKEYGQNLEENLKYLLFLVNELSNNPESFKKETSEFLIELAECLHDKFDEFWSPIETYLKEKQQYLEESIKIVKKDVEKVILQTLENIAEVFHFNEIDQIIANVTEEITKTGLIINEKAKKIQEYIIDFAQRLMKYGEGNYTFNGDMTVVIEALKKVSVDAGAELKAKFVNGKDIVILTNTSLLLNDQGGNFLQTLVFESPLVSVKANAGVSGNSETVNTFVNIDVYLDEKTKKKVENLKEEIRPKILYLKEKYNDLKACYYYDQEKQKLSTQGVTPETIIYAGKEYFSCVASHLTPFTAGTEEIKDEESNQTKENGEGMSFGTILLIVLGVILLLVILAVVIIMVRKKVGKGDSQSIDGAFNKDEGLVAMN